MLDGTVKWFNNAKGYGFIERNGKDYFAHFKEIQGAGYKCLLDGEKVKFQEGSTPKGATAKNIIRQEDIK